MWPSRSAIRAVPAYAVVPRSVIERLENEFYGVDDLEQRVDDAFHAMDRTQPALARFLARAVEAVPDETAQSLGHFLGVSVYQAFVLAFPGRLSPMDDGLLERTRTMIECDEELRRGKADESLETDDVIAIAQPHVIQFIRGEIDSALEPDEDGEQADVDIECIEAIYRAVLVCVLALGESVTPPHGMGQTTGLA